VKLFLPFVKRRKFKQVRKDFLFEKKMFDAVESYPGESAKDENPHKTGGISL